MTTYALYLESGPRRKKTYIHVPDLLGCMVRGDTTEAALEAAPEAIRGYLRFLQRHGETVDPDAAFTTEIAQHITKGVFLGNGTLTIEADHGALSADEPARYTRWLEWARADLEELIARLVRSQVALDSAPEGKRSIRAILTHIVEAEREYMRATFDSNPAINALLKAANQDGTDPLELLARVRHIGVARIQVMTPNERALSRQAGQQIWTARKMLRRMLEHQWEHLEEIARRG